MVAGYPDPRDPSWDPEICDAVIEHLKTAPIARAYPGWSDCRLCGCMNGTTDRSDGTFIWPEGLPHYLEEHDVRLPELFVHHVLTSDLLSHRALFPTDPLSAIRLMLQFSSNRVRVTSVWWRQLREGEGGEPSGPR